MGKCYGQGFFYNFSFIKCYLCVVFEQAYGDAPVRQAAFTLKMVFFPGFPDNCKVGVRDPFLVRGILLVYKMFVWKNSIVSLPVYSSPKISLIRGRISCRQSFKIVRNAPSYRLLMVAPFLFCGFIISFFRPQFKTVQMGLFS